MTSECPGWVYYAEKVVGEMAFPFMSKVKSPQQLCGLLLKHFLSLKYQVSPSKVKIVTVMPCYDKKLEAVRPNFTLGVDESIQGEQIKEVDTVLATHELVDLINNLATSNGLPASIESFSQITPYEYKIEEFKSDAVYSP
jgi:iron only hydrogenase large subunit-like protein